MDNESDIVLENGFREIQDCDMSVNNSDEI
jgi:hypothetical protein